MKEQKHRVPALARRDDVKTERVVTSRERDVVVFQKGRMVVHIRVISYLRGEKHCFGRLPRGMGFALFERGGFMKRKLGILGIAGVLLLGLATCDRGKSEDIATKTSYPNTLGAPEESYVGGGVAEEGDTRPSWNDGGLKPKPSPSVR